MYSEHLLEELDEKGIEVGDRVRVDGREGRLMPKPESGDPGKIVLKLENGYNIGVEMESIELVEKKKQDSEEQSGGIQHNEDKADILVIHTGGTIGSRVDYEKGGVKAAFEQEETVSMYPEVAEEVNIHSDVYVGEIMSEDMEPAHWQGIARKIDEVRHEYDGIIVGHGTDTLSDTAAALNLMLKGIDTGVLLVGAQRSSDRPSSDARMNVYCAAKFLSETGFQGIGVCMHRSSSDDECAILDGAKTRKMHTSRRDAFEAINTGEVGTVDYQTGEIKYDEQSEEKDYEPSFDLNENVGFLKVRPGIDPEEIEFLIEQDYDGVVIEGTGLGHMPISAFDEETENHIEIQEKLEELAEDAVVVMSSNCINGRVDMDVYANQRKVKERGVIGSEDMHPELTYVKLMWSLGQADSLEDAEQLFRKNVNGEISGRSLYNE
ncbi:MAG: Glu-tRNA(Gln) amidotransferase subunit GatD [Candidatus Nanohaloarchaea archaeon]